MTLRPCVACARHVRDRELTCPFCSAAPFERVVVRDSSAVLFFTATLALGACSKDSATPVAAGASQSTATTTLPVLPDVRAQPAAPSAEPAEDTMTTLDASVAHVEDAAMDAAGDARRPLTAVFRNRRNLPVVRVSAPVIRYGAPAMLDDAVA